MADLISNLSSRIAQMAQFDSSTRLYELTLGPDAGQGDGSAAAEVFLVEAFAAVEGLHTLYLRDVLVLSTDANVALKSLIGRTATLRIALSDGTPSEFTGLINEAALLGSEGGFARYRLRIVPWLWLLSQSRTSRVWQDKSIVDIVESVFAEYSAHAAWKWSGEVQAFLADQRPRSFTTQYRESNFDFVSRLLAEEGISFRIEQAANAPSGHQVVLFSDSTLPDAFPEDASSAHGLGGAGIRFHGGKATEEQDTIQSLAARRTLQRASVTLLSYDYKTKTSVSTSLPTNQEFGGKQAPQLESYDTPGQYAYADAAEAARYAQLHLQASEARNKLWHARGTVRTLRPGTTFALTQGPLDAGGDGQPMHYAVLAVTSVGINNLPKDAAEGIAELFGPLPELLEDCLVSCAAAQRRPAQAADTFSTAAGAGRGDLDAVIAQATTLGYANSFEAIRADVVWRPVLADGTGLRHNPRPTAFGSQSAIVVGANGETTPNGADEIYCDRMGRVRIRFHWQGNHDDANATCWVRVAQRSAGGGAGVQFLPRIGQEVLVQFLEGDIDRPVVLGALYNGQGEGGEAPTPGGATGSAGAAGADAGAAGAAPANVNVFEGANDQSISGQGNLVGSNGPAWHGASQDSPGHANAAAQWGVRTKEFGGAGYNQLLFDDTDAQGRIQLKTSSAGTELNLGHLVHTADNYRGSFRGTGSELRTDAYGAVRAGQGLLVTSYNISQTADARDPAGDNSAGQALLKQATILGKTFHDAAVTHKTVGFAAQQGPVKTDASLLDESAAPLAALQTSSSGVLGSASLDSAKNDAAQKNVQPGEGKVPHSSDAIIGIAAKAGMGSVAGQNMQLSNGETVALMSGLDSQFASGNQLRIHSGQAIGILGGAVKPGQNQTGLQLIASQQAIDLQAQADTFSIQAREQVSVISANAHIDWAAAKKITLSTAGGANITIDGGNITVQCPGKLTVHASQKLFDGPTTLAQQMNTWPSSKFDEEFVARHRGSGQPVVNRRFEITREDGSILRGATDAEGKTGLQKSQLMGDIHFKFLDSIPR